MKYETFMTLVEGELGLWPDEDLTEDGYPVSWPRDENGKVRVPNTGEVWRFSEYPSAVGVIVSSDEELDRRGLVEWKPFDHAPFRHDVVVDCVPVEFLNDMVYVSPSRIRYEREHGIFPDVFHHTEDLTFSKVNGKWLVDGPKHLDLSSGDYVRVARRDGSVANLRLIGEVPYSTPEVNTRKQQRWSFSTVSPLRLEKLKSSVTASGNQEDAS